MLEKFKELQRQKLAQLSEKKSQVVDKLHSQQQYLLQLEQYQKTLHQDARFQDALSWQNQHRLLRQVSQVVDVQQQQLALTQVDIEHHNNLIKQQYCHFKGLELVSDKKALMLQVKALEQEQASNDELATMAFIRRKNCAD